MKTRKPIQPPPPKCPDILSRLIRDLEDKKIAYTCYDVRQGNQGVTRVLKILDQSSRPLAH